MGISKTLATALLAAIPAAPVAQTPWPQAPGYYRMQLGDFRVTVLSDGSVDRDLPAIMSNPDLVRDRYRMQHQAQELR